MQLLFEETRKKAYVFLKEFGFDDDELEPVIDKGLTDLEMSIGSLSLCMESPESCTKEKLDGVLHGLKGLLFQLGNHDAANKVERLRDTEEPSEIKAWLESI
jgi:hypothetical protein